LELQVILQWKAEHQEHHLGGQRQRELIMKIAFAMSQHRVDQAVGDRFDIRCIALQRTRRKPRLQHGAEGLMERRIGDDADIAHGVLGGVAELERPHRIVGQHLLPDLVVAAGHVEVVRVAAVMMEWAALAQLGISRPGVFERLRTQRIEFERVDWQGGHDGSFMFVSNAAIEACKNARYSYCDPSSLSFLTRIVRLNEFSSRCSLNSTLRPSGNCTMPSQTQSW